MANRTDASAIKNFGSNPQYLISNIIRSKIYDSPYWKEKCFALTSESIIDQAINLKYVGGTYGGNRKPTRFLCLILKLLQIQPDKDIIYEYIKNEDFVYLRALGIFYLRLIGKSLEVYNHLEPILFDYRKIRMRLQNGTFEKIYMDVFVDNCLILNNFLDVDFPTLTKRQVLEENNLLERKNLEYYKALLNISSDNELFENNEDTTHNKNKDINKNKNEYKQRDMLERYKKINKYSSEDDHNYYHKKEGNYDKNKKHNKIYNRKYNNKYDNEERYHHSDYSSDMDRKSRKKEKKRTHSKHDHKKKKEKRKYSSDSKNSFTSSEYSVQNKKEEHDKKKKKLFFLKKQKKKNYHSSSQSNHSYDENKKDELSIDKWNEIRKELGMKPLK